MKKVIGFAAVFALFASTQAFAIAGVGVHYITNMGSLKSSKGTIDIGLPNGDITVEQKKADGLQGIGFKAWIDILPFIDIEGTFNISAARYVSSLIIPNPAGANITIPLEYAPDAPYNMIFDKASPIYGIVNGDLSITYPFDVLPLIRPYVGAGISYFASIPVVDAKFTQKVFDSMSNADFNIDPENPAAIGENLGDAVIKTLKDSDYDTGLGGHVIVGARVKAPIIPLAVYTNVKYYFGGGVSDRFTQGVVIEVGGGFAL